MRILVFSQAAWNTANAFGNTVANWFKDWKDTHFFHFYARQQKPDTNIVEKYYQVSAVEVLKKALKGKQAGTIHKPSEILEVEPSSNPNSEQKLIAKLHKSSNEVLYWGMEKVWRSKRWVNKSFDEFVDEADPDIIFAFATDPYILEPAIKHIKQKRPSVKVVLWIADDILTGFEQNAWYRKGYLKKGIDYCFNVADKIYGASAEMCEKYSRIYGKEITPLYKGCTFDRPVKEKNNAPLRLVYAGNLLYGRLDTLKEIIRTLRIINREESKAALEVYSNTPIGEEEKKQWFDGRDAFYMGMRPYEEIKGILNEADVVLHVESFEKNQMEVVKYSFSTKIIDCLQSGSVVVGMGPAGIASIEYLRKVDGAFIVDTEDEIEKEMSKIVSSDLSKRALQTRAFAVEKHDIKNVRERLHSDFIDLLKN